jgi:ADP-ribose pyrophosphatase YjhB (NUDIX family)
MEFTIKVEYELSCRAMYIETMHMYQKHILDLLRGADSLRYSELQPDGVESSHFKYHLDQLIRDGLVEKTGRGVYALSGKGKAAVDRLSVGRINPFQTPKVITYTLLQDADNYYLFRKDKAPFLGTLNMVSGKVHLDERSADASVREVMEKAGESIDAPRLKVIAEVRIHQDAQLISHFVAYVFVTEYRGDSPRLEKVAKRELNGRSDLASDLLELLRAINDESPYIELNL